MKLIKYIFVVAFLSSFIANAQNSITGTASIDSATIVMGGKTKLNVEFSGALSDKAHLQFDQDQWTEVEINPVGNYQLDNVGNSRRTLKQEFIIQAFDSGLYTLPPIYCVDNGDTSFTNSIVLKVEPVSLDSTNIVFENGQPVDLKINDYTDIEQVKRKILDCVPDWLSEYWIWILIALLIIAAGLYVYLKWIRTGKMPLILTKKQVPPYELALGQLNELQNKKLWQKGAEKEYYTQLTDILRVYLQGRFGINAMEMTTPQIIEACKNDSEATDHIHYIIDVLNEADFVKFAKAKPLADENEAAFKNTRDFVEETKPVAATEETTDENKE